MCDDRRLASYGESLGTAGIACATQVALNRFTSFSIGGKAGILVKPASREALLLAVRLAEDAGIRYCVIGRGSNLLVSDAGFPGAVIVTSGLSQISRDDTCLCAEAGVPFSKLSLYAAENAMTGLEFACGIPGSCGGAVYMNAGAFGSSISDVMLDCDFYDAKRGKISTARLENMQMSYRNSMFVGHPEWIILSCRLALSEGDPDRIHASMEEYRNRRTQTQPHGLPNAGSIFKRTPGIPAAKLIDECGLKGYRIGGAMVSEKHAGFIVNTGGAKASDVLALVEHIRQVVLDRYGVLLETEICYVE